MFAFVWITAIIWKKKNLSGALKNIYNLWPNKFICQSFSRELIQNKKKDLGP